MSDVSDLKEQVSQQGRLLQAVHLTQADHGVRLTRMETTLAGHGTKLDVITGLLTELINRADGPQDQPRPTA